MLQDVPDDLKARPIRTKGEASLRGHLKADEGKEQTGSQSYVPPDAKNDKALHMAMDLLRGTKVNSAFPPKPRRRCRTRRRLITDEVSAGRPQGPPRSFLALGVTGKIRRVLNSADDSRGSRPWNRTI